jgi:hypothetical protein
MPYRRRTGLSTRQMVTIGIIVVAVIVFLAVNFLDSLKPPVDVTFDTIAQQKEDTLVMIRGELSLPLSSTYSADDRTNNIYLQEVDGTRYINIFIVNVEYGKTMQPSHMAPLPEPYTSENLVVWTKDGKPLGAGDVAIITGWLGVTQDGEAYLHPVKYIEAP